MTLREYFAGLAMQAIVARVEHGSWPWQSVGADAVGADAVALADALIAALGSDPNAPVVGPVTGNVNACVVNDVRVKP